MLGSGARRESTLRTDQDHALVLAGDLPLGASTWFAALADRLTTTLEGCGLPRCRGGVMATNPAWRAPLGAWQDRFVGWIEQPEEDALLEATFFDFRRFTASCTPSRRCGGSSGERPATAGSSDAWPRRPSGAGWRRGS